MKKCDKCKKDFSEVVDRADGLPNGVGFELQNGKVITLCADCIKELGSRDRKGKNAFIKDLLKGVK